MPLAESLAGLEIPELQVWQRSGSALVNCADIVDPALRVASQAGRCATTPVNCPQSISLYNEHMGGVDQNDQLRGYYHVRLKCRKYYKYIFWFLFDVAVINSYITQQALH